MFIHMHYFFQKILHKIISFRNRCQLFNDFF